MAERRQWDPNPGPLGSGAPELTVMPSIPNLSVLVVLFCFDVAKLELSHSIPGQGIGGKGVGGMFLG